MTTALDAAAVRRARLRARLLVDRTGVRTPSGVAEAVVGIQAQDPLAAALQVRSRTETTVGAVGRAVGDRSLVLTWTLRGTRHYHAAADVRWLLRLLGPVRLRPSARARELGIDGDRGAAAVALVREALASEGPLGRAGLAARLAAQGLATSPQAPIHVVRRAALEGVLSVVPGTPERYALLDGRLPAGAGGAPDRGVEDLLRRYLRAFGPAGRRDFAAWSGLGAQAARAAWAALWDQAVAVEGPGGPLWVLSGAPVEPAGSGPLGVQLLGGFDALLLAYADRALHVAPGDARRVNDGGGMLRPVVVSDGVVCGTWSTRTCGGRRSVDVLPFRPLDAGEAAAVEAETRAVHRFLDASPQVRAAGSP